MSTNQCKTIHSWKRISSFHLMKTKLNDPVKNHISTTGLNVKSAASKGISLFSSLIHLGSFEKKSFLLYFIDKTFFSWSILLKNAKIVFVLS